MVCVFFKKLALSKLKLFSIITKEGNIVDIFRKLGYNKREEEKIVNSHAVNRFHFDTLEKKVIRKLKQLNKN